MSRLPIMREVDRDTVVSCGCLIPAGGKKWTTALGQRWTCRAHCTGKARDFQPRRGPASVTQILAAEAQQAEPAPVGSRCSRPLERQWTAPGGRKALLTWCK